MFCGPHGSDQLNSFAVVNYLHGALAEFIDRLRAELVPGCESHAHVTVLPPRPLTVEREAVAAFIGERLQNFGAFPVEATIIRVFPVTHVIYADIGLGAQELDEMHNMLNVDGLAFEEPFEYHPHLTLAQGLEPETVREKLQLAQRRWAEFHHSRSFMIDSLTFVQNTADNRWVDLAAWDLREPARVYSR